jgi:hypothetical protein
MKFVRSGRFTPVYPRRAEEVDWRVRAALSSLKRIRLIRLTPIPGGGHWHVDRVRSAAMGVARRFQLHSSHDPVKRKSGRDSAGAPATAQWSASEFRSTALRNGMHPALLPLSAVLVPAHVPAQKGGSVSVQIAVQTGDTPLRYAVRGAWNEDRRKGERGWIGRRRGR